MVSFHIYFSMAPFIKNPLVWTCRGNQINVQNGEKHLIGDLNITKGWKLFNFTFFKEFLYICEVNQCKDYYTFRALVYIRICFFSQVIRRMIVAVKVTLVVMIQVRRYLASPFAKEDPENISTMRRIQIFQSGRKPTARTNF